MTFDLFAGARLAARAGFADRGIWYPAREGVRGLLVKDDSGRPVVYVLCEPATRYYQVMTRSERMPVLIGETI